VEDLPCGKRKASLVSSFWRPRDVLERSMSKGGVREMELAGKKVAILVENKYNDFEFWYPYFRMKEAGARVAIVGTGASSYTSGTGLSVPHPSVAASSKELVSVDSVSGEDFECVIVPGGFAPDYMRRNPKLLAFVREMFEKGKVVAAICHAGWVLISAGIVRGKRATCFFAIKDDLVNAGANYVDEEVVRDGNLITSRCPDDLPAFCRTIIEALRSS
jgi:protease I